MTATIFQLGPEYLERPEFRPRVVAGDAGKPIWLPCHPALGARGVPAAVSAGAAVPLRGLFEEVARRWDLRTGNAFAGQLDRLDRPDVRVVIGGQQPGFLTGPLFTIHKAATVVGVARHLENVTGTPHVPVFWVAAEDHDLDEVREVRFPDRSGNTVTFRLSRAADRRPLSEYPVDGGVLETVRSVREHLAGRRFEEEVPEILECYREGRHLASAFAAALAVLFEPWGLVIIEPEVLRPHAAPIIRRVLEEPGALMEAIREGRERVRELGLRPAVPHRFPLFLLDESSPPIRHHLSPVEGGFELGGGGGRLSSDRILEILDRSPRRLSTGVLLRAVVQQALLPVSLAATGPGEIAYFAQLGPVFDLLGVQPTALTARLSVTLIEGKVARALRRLGIGPASLDTLIRAREPGDLLPPAEMSAAERRLVELGRQMETGLDEALSGATVPAREERKLKASGEKLLADLERLRRRVRRIVTADSGELRSAAGTSWNHLLPDGALQERRWNVLHYIAKYGREWIGSLVAEAGRDPAPPRHSWLFLE